MRGRKEHKNESQNFSKVDKNYKTTAQRTQRTPSTSNIMKTTPKYIIIKLLKTSNLGKILKAAKEKWNFIYRGTNIRIISDLLETMKVRS